jgi:hypothetical protein
MIAGSSGSGFGTNMIKSMEMLSRIAFGAASLVLMALSLALVVNGALTVVAGITSSWADASDALLSAIGYVVISIAVFDVAKYFIEEEVIRGRELRIISEARRSLTKFISTISIAVFIEALVTVFRVSKNDVDKLLYPTALLLTAIMIVVGLGLYQRLSAEVEQKVEAKDKAKRN